LGVSRIPVRDALRRLAAEGLVDLPATGSPTVAALSVEDLQELYELREAVEPLACRLAVPNIGRAQLLTMAESMAAMDDRQASDEWLEAHVRFHAQFYGQSGRPRMIALVENLRQQAERYLRLHLSSPASDHLRAEHHAMMLAAAEGDAAMVEKLTLEHLRTSHDSILSYLLDRDPTSGVDLVETNSGRPS
jgi:DNA-binding GntR family transcriptional regulator